MNIKRPLEFDVAKDLVKHNLSCNSPVFNTVSNKSELTVKSDNKELSADTNSNKAVLEQENPYEDLAGPSLIYKALDHVRRLNGTKPISKPLKVRYLPDEVKERIKDLEEEFEKESLLERNNSSDDNSNSHDDLTYDQSDAIHELDLKKYKSFKGIKTGNKADDSLFYKKAMQHVNRMNKEKNTVKAKISKNFKLFLIIIVAFAGYYAYQVNTGSDEERSVAALQAKLPIELDSYTTLKKVSLDDNSLNLEVIKSKEAFQEEKDLDSALNLYIQSASSNFCKIPLFSDMIKKGRSISVLLKADDSSFDKEFVVSHCDK